MPDAAYEAGEGLSLTDWASRRGESSQVEWGGIHEGGRLRGDQGGIDGCVIYSELHRTAVLGRTDGKTANKNIFIFIIFYYI